MSKSILIVDDEEMMLDFLSMILSDEYEITTSSDSGKALELLQKETFDLCLLDIMMPWIDGFDFIKQIRRQGNDMPVIFISARAELEDRVLGLELGADDYITKPFEPAEVLARVHSLLRRTNKLQTSCVIKHLGIRMDLDSKEVWADGEKIKLTPIEFELLSTMIHHPNQVFSREQLLESIWSYSFMGDIRTVDTHIKNLRLKLKKANFSKAAIHTVWGFGYKLGEVSNESNHC